MSAAPHCWPVATGRILTLSKLCVFVVVLHPPAFANVSFQDGQDFSGIPSHTGMV